MKTTVSTSTVARVQYLRTTVPKKVEKVERNNSNLSMEDENEPKHSTSPLECSICMLRYTTTTVIPRMLTACGHTVCQRWPRPSTSQKLCDIGNDRGALLIYPAPGTRRKTPPYFLNCTSFPTTLRSNLRVENLMKFFKRTVTFITSKKSYMIISHCLNAMPYNVVFNLEEQLQKFDDESEKHAEELRKTKEVFFDPDFPPNGDSLGNRKDENGKLIVVDYGDLWLTPQEIIGSKKIRSLLGDNKAASGTVNESALRGDQEALRERAGPCRRRMTSTIITGYREYSIDVIPDEKDKKWSLYDNPWPFHVKQGSLGDCWLIAAIQCIARRKDLLEHILPIRDYTEDSGIVPVRLFISGKWEVVKIDYHLPQYRNRERFAGVLNNQFWVSFIEKAYAKIQGSYANLKGGFSHEAFKYFTGFPAHREKVDKLWNPEKMWRRYSEYQ
ncbi:hypothetical protein CRE_16491 [Caenorhabditis remanei]|uniref:Calpain catalytic domain-containing protein n=1 Tax=Caenorhabditis remanei TaxID=31234 RepID=E3NL90_CAERE|nr:hypothetical protein CRE_16491 [Caenorhabditis remanei]